MVDLVGRGSGPAVGAAAIHVRELADDCPAAFGGPDAVAEVQDPPAFANDVDVVLGDSPDREPVQIAHVAGPVGGGRNLVAHPPAILVLHHHAGPADHP